MKINGQTPIRGKGWKKPLNISEEKYTAISKAILKTLGSEPMRFYDLVAKVEAEVTGFSGSVAWYTISVLRELETQGKVVRTTGKTTTYRKA